MDPFTGHPNDKLSQLGVQLSQRYMPLILNIRHIFDDLQLLSTFCPEPTIIHNDNSACILWSSNMTTKGLRHIQIRESAVRESIKTKTISVQHIAGSINISDLFTKEDKDTHHFISLRDVIMSEHPT